MLTLFVLTTSIIHSPYLIFFFICNHQHHQRWVFFQWSRGSSHLFCSSAFSHWRKVAIGHPSTIDWCCCFLLSVSLLPATRKEPKRARRRSVVPFLLLSINKEAKHPLHRQCSCLLPSLCAFSWNMKYSVEEIVRATPRCHCWRLQLCVGSSFLKMDQPHLCHPLVFTSWSK